MKVMQRQEDKF